MKASWGMLILPMLFMRFLRRFDKELLGHLSAAGSETEI